VPTQFEISCPFLCCNEPITDEMTRIEIASHKAKSLARLIAEEAFSMPAPQPALNVPSVRIVGRKLALAAPAEPAGTPAPPCEIPGEPDKKPRIFVIRPSAGEAPPSPSETTAAMPSRRRRRASAPAPAQLIYRAPERAVSAPVSLELLAGSLAGIEPTLEIIRRAMAFDFTDPAIVAEWAQLARVADELSELLAS
jgi:hypothetical protein